MGTQEIQIQDMIKDILVLQARIILQGVHVMIKNKIWIKYFLILFGVVSFSSALSQDNILIKNRIVNEFLSSKNINSGSNDFRFYDIVFRDDSFFYKGSNNMDGYYRVGKWETIGDTIFKVIIEVKLCYEHQDTVVTSYKNEEYYISNKDSIFLIYSMGDTFIINENKRHYFFYNKLKSDDFFKLAIYLDNGKVKKIKVNTLDYMNLKTKLNILYHENAYFELIEEKKVILSFFCANNEFYLNPKYHSFDKVCIPYILGVEYKNSNFDELLRKCLYERIVMEDFPEKLNLDK